MSQTMTVDLCDLRASDPLGGDAISGPAPGSYGSLLERSRGGQETLELTSGENCTFLWGGQEVLLQARAPLWSDSEGAGS